MASKTKITKVPSPNPANLRLKRGSENDNDSITAEWGVPADAIWESNHMWKALDEYWTFKASKNMSKTWLQQRGDGHQMHDLVWVRDRGADHSNSTVWFNGARYHPRTLNRFLTSVTCKLTAINPKGRTSVSSTLKMEKPEAPTIEQEFDEQTSIVTTTITTPTGENTTKHRYDTYACATIQQSANVPGTKWKKETVWERWRSFTDETKEYENNWSVIGSMMPGQWTRLCWKAYARGVAGNSTTTVAEHYFSYPPTPEVRSIVVNSMGPTGIVSIRIRTNHTPPQFPVDTVKLQRLVNTAISSAASAATASGWEDVDGQVDDFFCSGFSDLVVEALPQVKRHTWYRVVSKHDNFQTVSAPVEAKCLYRDKDELADDMVKFASIGAGADGESVVMKLAWKNDDSTDTEVSWSIHADAWESNEQPESMMLEWEDTSSEVQDWAHSANVTIRGLEEGTPVYVRARRARVDDETTYGPWCYPPADLNAYPVTPATEPTDVLLTAPSSVERGQGIDCTWTFNGAEQTGWNLYDVGGSAKTIIASGNDPSGGYTVEPGKFAKVDSLTMSVAVTTGGNWVESEPVTVNVADAPTVSIDAPATLAVQPLEFGLTCNRSTSSVLVYVTATSGGIVASTPIDTVPQADGESIWSETVTPAWVETGVDTGVFTATVTAPENLAFHEGGVYVISAIAMDGGLQSDEARSQIVVQWAHQAIVPDDASTVVPDVESMSATITPVAPVGAAQTDVCDIYRVTRDRAYLIAEGVPFGTSVTDRYAPYSNLPDAGLAYRLCTRTVDGDLEWRDIEYDLRSSDVRFDWDGDHLEVPYNVTTSSSWEKGFELVQRMDGTRVGSWARGSTRRERVTVDLVKLDNYYEMTLATDLAQHAGPVFVRTPSGSAFEGNADVTEMESTYESLKVPLSFDVTEVSLTEAFMVQPEDWSRDGE